MMRLSCAGYPTAKFLGTAPANIRHFIELRGIGIINVARVFGIGSVRSSVEVEMVVQLEPWDRTKNYDRTGLETEYYDILGVKVPSMLIPVMPGLTWPSFWKRLPSTTARRRWATTPPRNC